MVSMDGNSVAGRVSDTQASNKFYKAAWRWHFYAGLYIIPFFILLAVTGMTMLWLAYLDGRDGERIPVVPQEQTLAVSTLADAALNAVPEGELKDLPRPASRRHGGGVPRGPRWRRQHGGHQPL